MIPLDLNAGPLAEHVARLAGLVRLGEMPKSRAIDGLLDFWRLTRVGALDLLDFAVSDPTVGQSERPPIERPPIEPRPTSVPAPSPVPPATVFGAAPMGLSVGSGVRHRESGCWRGRRAYSTAATGAKRNMTNYISSFLQAHGDIIESTSLMSDQLTITFKPTVSVRRMVIVMADLINYVQPTKAHAHLENRMIRLEF